MPTTSQSVTCSGVPQSFQRVSKLRIAGYALSFVLVKPLWFRLSVDPVILWRVDQLLKVLVHTPRSGEKKFARHDEVPVEGENMALVALTYLTGDECIEWGPERVEVIAAHVGAVSAITDVVLAVQAYKSCLLVEPLA